MSGDIAHGGTVHSGLAGHILVTGTVSRDVVVVRPGRQRLEQARVLVVAATTYKQTTQCILPVLTGRKCDDWQIRCSKPNGVLIMRQVLDGSVQAWKICLDITSITHESVRMAHHLQPHTGLYLLPRFSELFRDAAWVSTATFSLHAPVTLGELVVVHAIKGSADATSLALIDAGHGQVGVEIHTGGVDLHLGP